jgi:hypothetical protein
MILDHIQGLGMITIGMLLLIGCFTNLALSRLLWAIDSVIVSRIMAVFSIILLLFAAMLLFTRPWRDPAAPEVICLPVDPD